MGGSFGSRTEFSKRSSERPACHFFARSACKHAEDCRFPHILPDGTDARGLNAGRSSHSIELHALSTALLLPRTPATRPMARRPTVTTTLLSRYKLATQQPTVTALMLRLHPLM